MTDERLLTPEKWISVADRLPTGQWSVTYPQWSKEVLIANSCSISIGYYDRDKDSWFVAEGTLGEDKIQIDKITHWMSLPANPHDKKVQLAKCKPIDITKEEAEEIVKGAAGRRPDFPSGKDYVDEVRGHKPIDRPKLREKIRAKLLLLFLQGLIIDGNAVFPTQIHNEEFLYLWADQILALVDREIEQAKNELTFELGEVARQATNKVIEQAKKEERGKIYRDIKAIYKNANDLRALEIAINEFLIYEEQSLKAGEE